MLLLSPSSRSGKWKRVIAAFVAALALIGAAYVVSNSKNAAPDVVFTSLTGQKIPLNALRGKVVLVNFWATSCAICVREMPKMVATYDQFRPRGLAFVAVAMRYDSPEYVLNFVQTRNLPFPVALDPQGELSQAFGGINATPTTFLIGKDGHIIKQYLGEPEFGELTRSVEQALSAPG
jgi:peroxiredoxin